MHRLRDLRQDRDLKQKDLARYLNIHQTTYSDYELGKLNVPSSILVQLSLFYNTSIDYLLAITDEPLPPKRKREYALKDGANILI